MCGISLPLESGRAGMRAGKTTLRAVMREANMNSWMAFAWAERKTLLRAFNGASVIGQARLALDVPGCV